MHRSLDQLTARVETPNGRVPYRRTQPGARAGIPARVAVQLTGHKTRSVFDRYDITSPGDLREAARKLDLGAATSEQVGVVVSDHCGKL